MSTPSDRAPFDRAQLISLGLLVPVGTRPEGRGDPTPFKLNPAPTLSLDGVGRRAVEREKSPRRPVRR